jgi:O-antigen chain-terminating methyltransferase
MNTEYYVQKLPEIYQKIYNYPKYDDKTSRFCDDRYEIIKNVISAYSQDFKGLKILDIGCAQGYFCLKLDELGADVSGIDFQPANIDVCNSLNQEFGRSVKFNIDCLTTEFVNKIPDKHYDFIFLFSVIHHVCHQHGYQEGKKIIKLLSQKTKFLFVELALKEEKVHWAESLHKNPEDIIDSFSFSRKLAEFPTHLTNIRRPLYLCSNDFCFIDNKFYKISSFKSSPHEFEQGSHQNTRKYFFSSDLLIKQYKLNTPIEKVKESNKREFDREKNVLGNYGEKIAFLPKLESFEENFDELYLIRKLYPGKLLSTCISENIKYDEYNVILDTLKSLVELEKQGLYHNDLRVWNILVRDQEKSCLIDYGAICNKKEENVFNSFISLVYDVIYRRKPVWGHYVQSKRGLNKYDKNYKNFILQVTALNQDDLSFLKILDLFENNTKLVNETELCTKANMNNYDHIENIINELTDRTIHATKVLDQNTEDLNRKVSTAIDELSLTVENLDLVNCDLTKAFENIVCKIEEVVGYTNDSFDSVERRLQNFEKAFQVIFQENQDLKIRIQRLEKEKSENLVNSQQK